MDYVLLSKTGPRFSRLVAGVMTWGVWGKNYHKQTTLGLIEHCLDLGISTFDHADIYGHYTTEETFGQAIAIKPSIREKMQLISKCGIRLVTPNRPKNLLKSYDTSRDYIISSTEQSLKNLQTDYLDLLLIHRPDPLLNPEEVAEAIYRLKRSGKIRAFGVSNFTPSQFALLNQATPLVTNQVEISALHRDPFLDGTMDQCMQMDIRPMAWSPLGGYFSNDIDPAVQRLKKVMKGINDRYGGPGEDIILLAWLLKHPSGILPVMGSGRSERISQSVKALEIDLDRQDWFAIWEAASGEEVA